MVKLTIRVGPPLTPHPSYGQCFVIFKNYFVAFFNLHGMIRSGGKKWPIVTGTLRLWAILDIPAGITFVIMKRA